MNRACVNTILWFAFALIIFISGCSEKPADIEKPVVVNIITGEYRGQYTYSDILHEGEHIICNASFTVIFSKEMEKADIAVSDTRGRIKLGGKYATWYPIDCMSYGKHTLVVTGTDFSGQELEAFEIGFYVEVVIDDYFLPRIVDEKCDPKNGAVGIDPQDYVEKLSIVFEKGLKRAEVTSTEPELSFMARISGDYREIFEIIFENYNMSYNTKFVITIYAMYLDGNESEVKYSFTTKDKGN